MGVQHTVSGSLHLYWFIEQDAILKKHAWPPHFNRLDLDWVTRSPTTCRELAMKKKRAWAARCNQVFCEWSKKNCAETWHKTPALLREARSYGYRRFQRDNKWHAFSGLQSSQSRQVSNNSHRHSVHLPTCSYSPSFTQCMEKFS